jgi:hypothetical protein
VLAKPQAAVAPQNVFVTRIGLTAPRASLGRVRKRQTVMLVGRVSTHG